MAKDPVCGMIVDEKTAKWVAEHNGRKYYFCDKHDMEEFKKDPEKYLARGK